MFICFPLLQHGNWTTLPPWKKKAKAPPTKKIYIQIKRSWATEKFCREPLFHHLCTESLWSKVFYPNFLSISCVQNDVRNDLWNWTSEMNLRWFQRWSPIWSPICNFIALPKLSHYIYSISWLKLFFTTVST